MCSQKAPHRMYRRFKPFTLLKADYNILARIIANRMKPILQDINHHKFLRNVNGTDDPARKIEVWL